MFGKSKIEVVRRVEKNERKSPAVVMTITVKGKKEKRYNGWKLLKSYEKRMTTRAG